MIRRFIAGLALGCFLLGGTLAMAQEGTAAPEIQYKKKTVYDFDDDLVEGELQRPDGDLVQAQRQAKHSSLIKIRQDFIPEMLKSAEDI